VEVCRACAGESSRVVEGEVVDHGFRAESCANGEVVSGVRFEGGGQVVHGEGKEGATVVVSAGDLVERAAAAGVEGHDGVDDEALRQVVVDGQFTGTARREGVPDGGEDGRVHVDAGGLAVCECVGDVDDEIRSWLLDEFRLVTGIVLRNLGALEVEVGRGESGRGPVGDVDEEVVRRSGADGERAGPGDGGQHAADLRKRAA